MKFNQNIFKQYFYSLQGRIVLFVIFVFLSFYGIAYYYASRFIDITDDTLAEKLIKQQVQITKERTLSFFDRDLKLIEIGVERQVYQNWMKAPEDSEKKKQAFDNLHATCRIVNCFGWFIFSNVTGDGYSFNPTVSPQPLEDDLDDSDEVWFRPLVSSGRTKIIDSNTITAGNDKRNHVPGVFLDYVVKENDEILGVVGTYAKLEDIIGKLLNDNEQGVINLVIDDERRIRLAPPENNKLVNERYKQFANIEWDEAINQSLLSQLQNIAASGGNQEFVTEFNLQGIKYLAVANFIEQVDWFVVSMYPKNSSLSGIDTLQLLFVSLAVLLSFIALTLAGLSKQVIKPIRKLDTVVDAIHNGDYSVRAPETGSSVIRNLGKKINAMAAQIASQLSALEQSNQALTVQTKKAEKANNAKSLFLSNMSHELRTPLNAVIGFSQFGLETESDAERKSYLLKIATASKHILHIVNDLLDLNKMDTDDFVLEHTQFELVKVIKTVLSIVNTSAEAKNLKLKFNLDRESPKLLRGDPLRLQQILLNLLSNAIKFTHEGEVKLTVCSAMSAKSKANFTFSVSDTGIGITQEQITKLFKPFSQADESTTRKYGGTGLGLTIVKQLATKMDGTVNIESEPDKGSTFSVFIPLEIVDPSTETSEKNEPLAAHKNVHQLAQSKRCLLVEDNKINQEIILKMLSELKMEIDIAGNGQIAVEMVESKNNYALILMDIQMPVMDGITATKKIREINTLVPIIGISAHGTKQDSDLAIQSGMNAYQTKPVDKTSLFIAIKKELEKAQHQKD